MASAERNYRDFGSFLRETFGGRVQKVPLDAGFTCPNRDGTKGRGGCIYCGGLGSGTGARFTVPDVAEQMRRGMERWGKRYKAGKFIAYFQSYTNTYGPVEHLERLYRSALLDDSVVGLAVGTRPDCVNEEVLALMGDLARECMVWVEYGLQSSHDETLALINRGHTFADFRHAVGMTKGRGVLTCAHVIIGLPGEGTDHVHATARRLAETGIDGVKLHVLYVLKNTPLAAMYRDNGFRTLDMAEYADLAVDFLERIPSSVVVQRLAADPSPAADLVAPAWAVEKRKTVELIERRFRERNTRQGKLCGI